MCPLSDYIRVSSVNCSAIEQNVGLRCFPIFLTVSNPNASNENIQMALQMTCEQRWFSGSRQTALWAGRVISCQNLDFLAKYVSIWWLSRECDPVTWAGNKTTFKNEKNGNMIGDTREQTINLPSTTFFACPCHSVLAYYEPVIIQFTPVFLRLDKISYSNFYLKKIICLALFPGQVIR